MRSAQVFLVFPCYNPTPEQWEKLGRFLNELESKTEIRFSAAVVDDGSPRWVEPPKAIAERIKIHRLPANRGKGGALNAATALIPQDYEVFAFLDFDLPYPAEDLIGICASVLSGADACIGDRTLQPQYSNRGSRNASHFVFRLFIRTIIAGGVPDTQCGIKAYRADMVKRIAAKSKIDGFLFDVEWLYLALKHRMAVRCWPVSVTDHHESSPLRSFANFKLVKQLTTLVLTILRREYEDQALYALLGQRRAEIADLGVKSSGTRKDANADLNTKA